MAKILCTYFGLSMAAEGESEFVGRQAAAFLGYVQQDAERCAEPCELNRKPSISFDRPSAPCALKAIFWWGTANNAPPSGKNLISKSFVNEGR